MNFLVLQKDLKNLVHNLSVYEKLEQSTQWIIQKKWGKDFTFGSDCTVYILFNFFPLQTYFYAKSHLLSMLKSKKSDH